jgi:hypothetical protein
MIGFGRSGLESNRHLRAALQFHLRRGAGQAEYDEGQLHYNEYDEDQLHYKMMPTISWLVHVHF